MEIIPGCLFQLLSGISALSLGWFTCVPVIKFAFRRKPFMLSSRNLMDGDVQDSFKLSCFMKQLGTLIENLTHYTSFCIKCTNVLYNFDISVIT